jgi:hypothetical protein
MVFHAGVSINHMMNFLPTCTVLESTMVIICHILTAVMVIITVDVKPEMKDGSSAKLTDTTLDITVHTTAITPTIIITAAALSLNSSV